MSNSPGPGRYRRRIGRRATRIESNYLGARTPREAGRLGIAGGDRVGKGGVEPPHRFRYTDLNRARLPFRHLPGAYPKERRLAAATVARRPGLEMGVPQGRPIESPDASRDARSSAPAPMTVEGGRREPGPAVRTPPRGPRRRRLRPGVQRPGGAGRDRYRPPAGGRRQAQRHGERAGAVAEPLP